MKKAEAFFHLTKENQSLYRCPLCGGGLKVKQAAVICEKNHNFSLSSKGYINFNPQAHSKGYEAILFESRRRANDRGFFNGLYNRMASFLPGSGVLLDAGCGEGSAISHLSQSAQEEKYAAFGLDLSKEAIETASRGNFKPINWVVADLAAIPLRENSADCILNILSPGNYREFQRVLKPGGILAKVVPGEDYMREIREFFGHSQYSDKGVKKHFGGSFPGFYEDRISYPVKTNPEYLADLALMSPLSWNAQAGKVQELAESGIKEITASFELLVWEI